MYLQERLAKVFEAFGQYADMKAANRIAEAGYRSAPFTHGDLQNAVQAASFEFSEAVRLAVIEALGGRSS